MNDKRSAGARVQSHPNLTERLLSLMGILFVGLVLWQVAVSAGWLVSEDPAAARSLSSRSSPSAPAQTTTAPYRADPREEPRPAPISVPAAPAELADSPVDETIVALLLDGTGRQWRDCSESDRRQLSALAVTWLHPRDATGQEQLASRYLQQLDRFYTEHDNDAVRVSEVLPLIHGEVVRER